MASLESIRQSLISTLTQGDAENMDWYSIRVMAEEAEAEAEEQYQTLRSAQPFWRACVAGEASFLDVSDVVEGIVTEEAILQWVLSISDVPAYVHADFGCTDPVAFSRFLQQVANFAPQIATIANEVAAGNTMWNL